MRKIKIFIVMLFALTIVSGCSCTQSMCNKEDLDAIRQSIDEKWKNNSTYIAKLEEEAQTKGITDVALIKEYVDQKIEKKVEDEYNNHPKACLTTEDMEDPNSGAIIKGKTWGGAFKEGLLEGLIVFPISWLLITFASLFGNNGFGKILSIVVVTIIIKSLMLLLTFKQQVQTQKLQAIQPELNELSKQLNNPNLSQNEKYRLQIKMMDIYKKNNINPLASLLPTFLSLPIFLSVWSAVSQTMVIRTGKFLGIELGATVSTQVFDFNIGAIVLFLLMAAFQVLSMKIPEILRKRKADYKEKQKIENSNNQMKTTMNIMIILILFTGFMLPAALAVYWVAGALFSILQTVVFQSEAVKSKLSAIGNRKKKAKVVQ